MKNWLIILGATAALAGCDMMTGPAGTDAVDTPEAAMAAPATAPADATDTAPGARNGNQNQSREQMAQ
ncbi:MULTISPECIES: hypothetical protein [Thioclava]|uniref:hypothetical protein n=1 Tax=Thioclava TaxID=285107 RepID=UPI000B53AA30|nr:MULTISPECIES: hypothetical protein [Thioclava]OWY04776.1 hypothetical protein B6V75_01095 [Thioclava sp. F1Mire-8]OWY06404.1 hypothetical protein B6V76_00970 [Thioclava sp. IC9]OWY15167.1 hypothetical protein B6V72_00780 [Thioclava sp. F34-6]OWY18693.1 hypothetical protein B6V73_02580 [Thioclava sp. JM3]PWE50685.1 hypothetical protein DEM26_07205 [Thioclava sp. NG1]